MCGTPDYGSLILMAERMAVLGVALLSSAVLYFSLSKVGNRELSGLQKLLKRLKGYFRLR